MIGGIAGLVVGHRARRQPVPVAGVRGAAALPRPDAEDHLLPGDDHVVRRGRRARRSRWARCRASFRSRSAPRPACARSTRVLIRVGQQLSRVALADGRRRSTCRRCAQPVVNGFRLGLGVAIIGTLLAETKLSNKGIGYLIIQAYATFDMPRMYALLIVLFVLVDRRQRADRALRARRSPRDGVTTTATPHALPAPPRPLLRRRLARARSTGAATTTYDPGTGESLGDGRDGRRGRRRRGRRGRARAASTRGAPCAPLERARILREIAARVREHADELAWIDASERRQPGARDGERRARSPRRSSTSSPGSSPR